MRNAGSRDAGTADRSHRVLIALFAVLAHCYLLLPLAASLLLFGFAVYGIIAFRSAAFVKLGVASSLLMAFAVRSFWIKLEPPSGLELEPEKYPSLFRDIETIRTDLRALRIHSILLDRGLEATLIQTPRLGLIGAYQNDLVLGIAMLQALSPEELRAILVRELAHTPTVHGRLGAWIHRVRTIWSRLSRQMELSSTGAAWMYRPFIRWFAITFENASRQLTRAQVVEADRAAMQIAGPVLGATLTRLHLATERLDHEFWPLIHKRCSSDPEPPRDVYELMRRSLMQPFAQDQSQQLLQESAATYYLGEALPSIQDSFGKEWAETVRTTWQNEHREMADTSLRLALLENKARLGALNADETFDYALWTERLHGAEKALPLYESMATTEPSHAPCRFALGRLRLNNKDKAGLQDMEEAMALDPQCTPYACREVAAFMESIGDEELAISYRDRAEEAETLLTRLDIERERFSGDDILLPTKFRPQDLTSLRELLNRDKCVREAYLAEKYFSVEGQSPMLLLGLQLDVPWFRPAGDAYYQDRLAHYAQTLELPDRSILVILNTDSTGLKRRLRKIVGSRLK
jgi:hypothetical protein